MNQQKIVCCKKDKNQPLEVSYKKTVLKHFVIFRGKYLFWSLFLMRRRAESLQLYYKETPAKVFFCDYCQISKNTYFEEHLRTAASENIRSF